MWALRVPGTSCQHEPPARVRGNTKPSDFENEIKIQVGFPGGVSEFSLQGWKAGGVTSLAAFPTALARFQRRSARVTRLCGFHLVHHDLQCDGHGGERL